MNELESERLRLRPLAAHDFEHFVTFFADGERAHFVGGPAERTAAWRLMAIEIGHWALRGYGMWALETKATGEFIGCCGLWNPEGWPEPEVGYWLMRAHEGNGYATEAAHRARAHAYDDLGWTTLISCIDRVNTPSIRVAERLGAVYEKTVQLPVGIADVYRHPGPAALARCERPSLVETTAG